MTDFSQSPSAADNGVLQPLTPPSAGTSSPPSSSAPRTAIGPVAGTPMGAAHGEPIPVAALGSQWDLPTKRTVLVILLVAAVTAIWISRQVIPLLVIAGIIAYILSPLVDLLERIRIPRAISTLVIYILLVVGLSLAPFLIVPVLVAQLASLSFDVPSTAFELWGWLGEAITNLPSRLEVLGFEVPIEGLTQQIEASFEEFIFIPTLAEILNYIQQLISTATNVMSSTAAIGFSVVGGIFNVLIAVLVVFFLSLYLTKDAPEIRAYVESLFPQSYQSEWVDLLRRMGYIWQAFFRGQITLCIIIGVSTGLALHFAGMPGALVLGLLAAVLEVIPNLGPIIAMIPAVIIALIQGSSVLSEYGVNNFGFALITVAIYFVIQQLEAYILVPRIIGGNVRLHPVVVVAGVAIGYNVAGIGGAFFAAPVIATCRVVGAYIHAKLLDYPPFYNQPLPMRKRRRPFSYRRTVTGDELAAHSSASSSALDMPLMATPNPTATDTAATDTAVAGLPSVTSGTDGDSALTAGTDPVSAIDTGNTHIHMDGKTAVGEPADNTGADGTGADGKAVNHTGNGSEKPPEATGSPTPPRDDTALESGAR